jgi:multidrug resistance efflux pump
MFNDREARQIASAICNAAKQINDTVEKMIADLPRGASPEMAMQCLAVELSDSQPFLVKAMLEREQARIRLPMTRVSAPESVGASGQ